MRMKWQIISVFLCLGACSPQRDNSFPANFSEEVIQKVSGTECSTGRKLSEVTITAKNLIPELATPANRIVGIMNGQDRCALTKNIDDGTAFGKFELKIATTCLENGGIWKVIRSSQSGGNYSFGLQRLDKSEAGEILVTAPEKLSLTYPRDHAGVRLMICK